MRVRETVAALVLTMFCWVGVAQTPADACRRAAIEGEVDAGKPFSQAMGNGLKVYLQPIHSGWILRVLPVAGPMPEHDYAELATPPYNSVTPLSISTDFAFRAQDAIGWNPRRFHFATSSAAFQQLKQAYTTFQAAGAAPPDVVQAELAHRIAQASAGTFTILDSRLEAGTADQWRMAGAVASHFSQTAHTLVQGPGIEPTPLGRLVWLRFRIEFDLPAGFAADPALHVVPAVCGSG
jgi:hypothetical protein